MPTDAQKLRPGELCRLLNSTPLGEVITEPQLRRQRHRGGMRFEDCGRINLLRYIAWLVQQRHAPKTTHVEPETSNRDEPVVDAAARAALGIQSDDSGRRLTPKQEAGIAALLTERSYSAAATKVGVSRATLYRWLDLPKFKAAYRLACRDLVATPLARIQAATGGVVTTMVDIALNGKRESDRLRAGKILLDMAQRIRADADDQAPGRAPASAGEVAQLLANLLGRLDESEAPASEKAQLVPSLSRTLLKALGDDQIVKRLQALEAILANRPTPEDR